MKRYVAPLILLAALAALAVVGTAGASHQVKSPVKGSFRYCSDPTFPPMESTTTAGKPTGFDIDMANAIGKFWKVKANFVQTAFPGLLPALSAKKCNMVISGIFITPDRVKSFPAVSYMKTHRALVVQAGNPKKIKGPNDLSGKLVAVQAGTKYEEYLKALNDQFKSSGRPQFTLQSYPGDTDAVAQLLIGRADAVLTQDTSGAFQKQAPSGQARARLPVPGDGLVRDLLPPFGQEDGRRARASRSRQLKKNGTLKKIAAKHQIPVSDVK